MVKLHSAVGMLRATHVRSEAIPTYDERTTAICARCGRSRRIRPERQTGDLCVDCLSTDPTFGTVPFEDLPVSDSNVCAFDDEFITRNARNKRRRRAAKEHTP